MDVEKGQALKDELAEPGEQPFVGGDRFFDGNDDLGSIGCNLDPTPASSHSAPRSPACRIGRTSRASS